MTTAMVLSLMLGAYTLSVAAPTGSGSSVTVQSLRATAYGAAVRRAHSAKALSC